MRISGEFLRPAEFFRVNYPGGERNPDSDPVTVYGAQGSLGAVYWIPAF